MKFFDYLRIALKNLWRRKLRTFLTVIAVSIGVTAVFSLLAIAIGARNAFLDQFESIGMLTQINVIGNKDVEDFGPFGGQGLETEDDEDATKLTEELIDQFQSIDHVTFVYPSINAWAYQTFEINLDGENTRLRANIESVGIDPDNIEDSDMNLAAGRMFTSANETHTIIIGDSYRRRLEKEPEELIGKEIKLVSYEGYYGFYDKLPEPNGNDEEWKNHKSEITATIIGVTPPGPNEYGLYLPVEWIKDLNKRKEYKWPEEEEWEQFQKQKELGLIPWDAELEPEEIIINEMKEKGYGNVVVKVDNMDNAESVAQTLRETYNVGAITPQDILDQIFQVFKIIEIVLGAIGSIALGVAAIGIVNTMVMSIYERTREIGVMKAVGASKSAIRRLFTIEAGFIGIIGGLIGIGFGYTIAFIANIVANNMLEEQGMTTTDIIELPLYLFVGSLGIATILGTLAGLYPAMRAAKLNAIEALHRE